MNVWGEIPVRPGSTALNAVFLEPEVWVETLGTKYGTPTSGCGDRGVGTRRNTRPMIAQEPVRPVLVFKMPESAVWTGSSCRASRWSLMAYRCSP